MHKSKQYGAQQRKETVYRDTLIGCAILLALGMIVFVRYDPRLPDWDGEIWLPLIMHSTLLGLLLLLVRERISDSWDAWHGRYR